VRSTASVSGFESFVQIEKRAAPPFVTLFV
jgi:hypothetical protein